MEHYGVITVGGGSAGIAAAIGARHVSPNLRILAIESEACLGGAATHRGVLSYCGLYACDGSERKVVSGVWDELHMRLLEAGAVSPKPTRHRGVFLVIDPEGVKPCLDELLAENDISVLLHTTVVGADRTPEGRISAVEIQERRGRRKILAKAFIDCSGDCDLAYYGGAATRYGNNGHVNLGSLSTRFGGLSSVSPTAEDWKAAIIAAKEQNPELRSIIPKNSSVLLRLPGSGDVVTYLASADYDARESSSITIAEQQARKQAKAYMDILRKLPGHENMYLVSTGPNFGTRESRHIEGRYRLKQSDVLDGVHFPDVIAIEAWGMEWHDATKTDWSSSFQLPSTGCFEIPLGCLWSVDTENLFAAGRCVDGDQYAGAAVRVMGTAMATGQAAGVAAGLTAATGRAPEAVTVRAILKAHGASMDPKSLPYVGPFE